MATSIWYQEFVAHRCTARRFPGRWRLHRRRHHRHRYRCRHQHEGWVDRCRRGKQERFSRPSRSTTAPIYLRAALSLSFSHLLRSFFSVYHPLLSFLFLLLFPFSSRTNFLAVLLPRFIFNLSFDYPDTKVPDTLRGKVSRSRVGKKKLVSKFREYFWRGKSLIVEKLWFEIWSNMWLAVL